VPIPEIRIQRKYRFKANFSGGHDDTVARLIPFMNDAPLNFGCISAVSYPERFGFLSLFIVRPEFRGQGFGSALWRAALATFFRASLRRLRIQYLSIARSMDRRADFRKLIFAFIAFAIRPGKLY